MSTTIIYGPPGTGKTTRLLELMEHELASGVEPARCAYVSFTKAAVAVARTRAREKFQCAAKDLQWFRTLHSLAFAAVGASRDAMMTDYAAFGEECGFDLPRHRTLDDGVFRHSTEDDRLVVASKLAAATGLSIDQVLKRYGIDVSPHRFVTFQQRLTDWKARNDRLEFSDLIAQFNADGQAIDCDVAFIDEAQDLTPAQWEMVGHAFAHVQRLFIAGDDDQAIYHWAGADVGRMLALEGEVMVLNHSYRLPKAMHTLAGKIAAKIRTRKAKSWSPNRVHGVIHYGTSLKDCDFGNGETWRCIARTGVTLPAFTRELESRGMIYRLNGTWSLPQGQIAALETARRLRAGAHVPMGEARSMLQWATKPVATAVWRGAVRAQDVGSALLDDVHSLFGKLAAPRRRYMARLRSLRQWDIDVSTIHQAKGAEAANVILSPDLSRAAEANLHHPAHADHERRVLYVAVTRAQRHLFIMPSSSEFAYNLGI